MADLPISGLPVAAPLSTTDVFPVVQAATTVQASLLQVLTFVQGNIFTGSTSQYIRGNGTIGSPTNGLGVVSGNIAIGGTLVQNTNLLTGGFNFYLGDGGGAYYLDIRPTYSHFAHNTENRFDAPLNSFLQNLRASYATPSTVPYLDASRNLISSAVTPTELGYLSGVSSNIQTQINNINSGLSWKVAVRVASTGDLTLTGATIVDGVAVIDGDRVLAKDQINPADNGVYIASTSGAWVRSTDCSTGGTGSTGILSATVVVQEGATHADQIWTCSSDAPLIIGIDAINFVKTSATTYTADGSTLTLTGNQFGISGTYAGQTSISSVGTITSGTWQGTVVSPTYGGTGVNNGTRSITLGGNLTTSGAFNTTLTVTGATNVTLPTTGSLITNAYYNTVQTLTDGATISWDVSNGRNATVTLGGNRTLGTPTNVTAGEYYTLKVVQDATGSRTLTLPAGWKVANAGAGAVTLSTAASAIDILTIYYDGSTYFVSYGNNFTS